MIHQELALVPGMTVYENIFLGIEENTLGVLNKKNYKLFEDLDKRIGFNLDPNKKIHDLYQQLLWRKQFNRLQQQKKGRLQSIFHPHHPTLLIVPHRIF